MKAITDTIWEQLKFLIHEQPSANLKVKVVTKKFNLRLKLQIGRDAIQIKCFNVVIQKPKRCCYLPMINSDAWADDESSKAQHPGISLSRISGKLITRNTFQN